MSSTTKRVDTGSSGLSEEKLAEVIHRLSILYPESEFLISGETINILVHNKESWPEIKQATHDQLLRTKYERDTEGLRHKLYTRLLN